MPIQEHGICDGFHQHVGRLAARGARPLSSAFRWVARNVADLPPGHIGVGVRPAQPLVPLQHQGVWVDFVGTKIIFEDGPDIAVDVDAHPFDQGVPAWGRQHHGGTDRKRFHVHRHDSGPSHMRRLGSPHAALEILCDATGLTDAGRHPRLRAVVEPLHRIHPHSSFGVDRDPISSTIEDLIVERGKIDTCQLVGIKTLLEPEIAIGVDRAAVRTIAHLDVAVVAWEFVVWNIDLVFHDTGLTIETMHPHTRRTTITGLTAHRTAGDPNFLILVLAGHGVGLACGPLHRSLHRLVRKIGVPGHAIIRSPRLDVVPASRGIASGAKLWPRPDLHDADMAICDRHCLTVDADGSAGGIPRLVGPRDVATLFDQRARIDLRDRALAGVGDPDVAPVGVAAATAF